MSDFPDSSFGIRHSFVIGYFVIRYLVFFVFGLLVVVALG